MIGWLLALPGTFIDWASEELDTDEVAVGVAGVAVVVAPVRGRR